MGTARAGRRRSGRSRGRGRPEARGWRPGSPRCGRTRPGRARRARAERPSRSRVGRAVPMPYRRAGERPRAAAAVVFDFNGTISDDEPLLAELCTLIFGEIGIEVTEERYFSEFAGYSDPEIVERVLAGAGRPDPAVAQGLLDRRTELYLARAGTGETVHRRSPHACARSPSACRSRSPPAPSAQRSRPCWRAAACSAHGGRRHGRRRRPREARPGGLPDRARAGSASAVPTRCRSRTPTSASWRRSPPGCGASASGATVSADRLLDAGAEAVVAGLDWSIPTVRGLFA